eukprot:3078706-Prymnesium_polylepis.1
MVPQLVPAERLMWAAMVPTITGEQVTSDVTRPSSRQTSRDPLLGHGRRHVTVGRQQASAGAAAGRVSRVMRPSHLSRDAPDLPSLT